MMPRGSADVRGEQLAAIETEQHAILTSPKVSRLLDRAQAGRRALWMTGSAPTCARCAASATMPSPRRCR